MNDRSADKVALHKTAGGGYSGFMLSLDNVPLLTVNEVELAVVEAGEGDALVLVHGSVSDLRTWSNQFDLFAKKFRTISYSRRYHLPNEPISADAPDPIQTHVDDLAGLIKTLGARPVHVVGHSWGGLIALLLAVQKPDLCRSLVLVEPPVLSMDVSIPPKVMQMIKLFFQSPKLAVGIAKLGGGAIAPAEKAFKRGDDKAAIEYFGRGVLGDRGFESLTEERYQQVWDNRGAYRAQAMYGGFPDLIGENFANVTMPVLLVNGSESPAIFGLLIDSLLERLSHARKCVVPGASHFVQEDSSSEFDTEVLKFLGEVG